MGLLSIIRKQKLKDKEVRILMLGLDNSGKTTIVKNLLHKDPKETSPTMGFNIETVTYKEKFNLNIWDIGGQTTLRAFWFNYFEKTDFLVWVIDSSCLFRLQENFEEFKRVLSEDRLVGCGLLVLINKVDLFDGDVDKLRNDIIEELELVQLDNHNWEVLCVSGYTGENLDRSLDWIVNEYEQRYFIL
ncbi:hypothetical protein CANARDRAFT_9531 [[Candida] arabinofermentans NRRL YB-2248]|uniref:ADP-ribosylation factor-like protein 2 n=1 Tax=[Candida] arabinofermentans NRRL YB-2248 TaxID=983967 RepID=A0A1E4SVF8_9ASCO|nr:hypothetical protein CANARDRAFT_9531 [[Candida] arabinofermentans NRRL YB-2248]